MGKYFPDRITFRSKRYRYLQSAKDKSEITKLAKRARKSGFNATIKKYKGYYPYKLYVRKPKN